MLNTYVKNKQQSNWDDDYANISIASNINGNKTLIDIELDNEDLANILKIPSVVTPIDKRLKMDFFGSFKPFRIFNAKSNGSNPFISAPERGVLNEKWCKREPRFLHFKMPRIETPYVPPIKPCMVETVLPLNDTILPLLETKLHLNDLKEPLNDTMLPLNYKKQYVKHNSYLSSPLPDEELIAPISILNKPINNYTLTPHKRRKRHKTHKTYKVYKKHKLSSRRIKKFNSKNNSKSISKSKTSKPYYALL